MLDVALDEFGKRMGLPALNFSPQGRVEIDIQTLGRLYFERNSNSLEDEVLIYLACDIPDYDNSILGRALDLCHYRHNAPFPLSAGLHGKALLLLTRVSAGQVSAAILEQAVMLLFQSLKTIQGV